MFLLTIVPPNSSLFFFNDTATTEIYTLSLHDALPISHARALRAAHVTLMPFQLDGTNSRVSLSPRACADRKSTRLNSSHSQISYAVFCLKKKKYIPAHRRVFATLLSMTLSPPGAWSRL